MAIGSGPSGHGRRAKSDGWGKALAKLLVRQVEKVDFLALVDRLAASDRGRPWLDRFKDLPPSWPDQEGLKRKAVALTLAQLKEQGEAPEEADLAALMERISCRYDHHIHIYASASLGPLFDTLFIQPGHGDLFTSPDGRDLAHLEELKEHRRQGRGVVYLINHSSHLDEFLVDCVLVQAGLDIPLFAAGDNMMAIKSLAKILMSGSYVVQRRGATGRNLAALFNYCRAISEIGGQQGIFLEAWHGGARSRDGSLRYPRRLVTLRGAIAGENDVVIQPVAVSYAVVPEDLSLSANQGGLVWIRGLKVRSLLLQALLHPKSFPWLVAKGLYGRAYVTLGRPRLLSQLKEDHARQRSDLLLDEYVSLQAIDEIARIKKVMASQVVARGLLRARRWGRGKLLAAVKYELDSLKDYHRATFGQEPDLEDFIREHTLADVVRDGLKTLRKRHAVARVSRDQQGLPKVLSLPGLSFYATHGDRRIYSPTAEQNIVVVGADSPGFALTYLVGHRILEERKYLNASLTLFDPRPEKAEELTVLRHPPGDSGDHRLPKNAFVTSDPLSAFRKANEVILSGPAHGLADQVATVLETAEKPLNLILIGSGFDPSTHDLPCRVVQNLAAHIGRAKANVFTLAGPVSTADLLSPTPTLAVLAGPPPLSAKVADLFRWPPLVIEVSADPVGVEVASIMARVYTLWGHFLARTGKVTSPSQIGLYMTRAAAETTSLGQALGGDPATFQAASPAWTATLTVEGLSGTARDFGRLLGNAANKKEDLPRAAAAEAKKLLEAGKPVPAYWDLRSARILARRLGLTLPLLEEAALAVWGEA